MRSLLIASVLIAVVVILIYSIRSGPSRNVMNRWAEDLVSKSGGPTEVCGQANQLFNRFGTSKVTVLKPSDVKDYPAIAALGIVDGILPGDPPSIKIRVGNHIRGFIMELGDTREGLMAKPTSSDAELIAPCIVVHR